MSLFLDALVLHLEEEVPGPRMSRYAAAACDRLLLLFGADAGRDFPLQAAAEADQSVRVLREQVLVDARLVVEALGVAGRHELDEVVIPSLVSASRTRWFAVSPGVPLLVRRSPGAT